MSRTDEAVEDTAEAFREGVGKVYRSDSRRVFATLVRLLGDFDLAEDALHNAFAAALERWPEDGMPANPRAWLVSAGRFKAIDALRRRARFDAALGELADRLDSDDGNPAKVDRDGKGVEDDRLRTAQAGRHTRQRPVRHRMARITDSLAPVVRTRRCGEAVPGKPAVRWLMRARNPSPT